MPSFTGLTERTSTESEAAELAPSPETSKRVVESKPVFEV